ncbi:Uncharacterized protein Rs2_42322 [Raphanus sativus]|uniref:Uncharacterized protein LOC108823379 n=1 Tax=Raphanus sativus TaxID=3726 RepID=A0A6J0KY53_RAPSA|nr:uncharacterized protein LOC108823379 [Raphanus sativus]KAJ4877304.1 Uncharacterized protein Rs2_42322 [Raphanus sativus]
MKLSESRSEPEKRKRQQHFDHDLKNMISSLTHMGADKAGPSQYEEEEEDGIGVITLSGTNVGATMKTELDDDNHVDSHKNGGHELDSLTTFVNSNFQAVNNSIMIGAKYETHDPGVHLDISGDVEKPPMKAPARGTRGKKDKSPVRRDRRESEHTD